MAHVSTGIALMRYAQSGDMAKAAAERKKALARKPEVTVAWYRDLLSQQQYETFFEPGLRNAAFPEK